MSKCPKLLARLAVEEGIPPTVARGLVETRKVHPSVCGEHTLEFCHEAASQAGQD